MRNKKIFLISNGLEAIQRGFEIHIQALFKNIKNLLNANVILVKGSGKKSANEIKINNLSQKSILARIIGFIFRKNPYTIHLYSFFIGSLFSFIIKRPAIIYLGEPILYSLFYKWRKVSKQKFSIIFFTGGQSIPKQIGAQDYIQHVTPLLYDEAIKRNSSSKNQFLIPHFLVTSTSRQLFSEEEKNKVKSKLNIPNEATIILSVGAIDQSVKRMDYIIREIKKLTTPFYLFLLGEKGSESDYIINLANITLPKNTFKIDTLKKEELDMYYQIADVFILASLKEGFGLVYIEALYYGLPVIAHDFPVSRHVLSNYGYFSDLEKEGELSKQLEKIRLDESISELKKIRSDFAYQKYSWESLKKEYITMFNQVLNG